jgi:hypothetical protein
MLILLAVALVGGALLFLLSDFLSEIVSLYSLLAVLYHLFF